MACNPDCKPIGEAKIGTSFIVGCTPCPIFPANARRLGTGVKLLKKKFQKIGIVNR